MSLIAKIEGWGESHRPAVVDYLRIMVGLYITYKGMAFTANIEQLQSLIGGYDLLFASIAIAHYVIFAHVLGGALLAFGLFTRVMCALNIPILIGAVFLVNYPKGFMSMGDHMELEISVITLVLLLLCLLFGSGKLSIDEMRRKDEAARGSANQ